MPRPTARTNWENSQTGYTPLKEGYQAFTLESFRHSGRGQEEKGCEWVSEWLTDWQSHPLASPLGVAISQINLNSICDGVLMVYICIIKVAIIIYKWIIFMDNLFWQSIVMEIYFDLF